MKIFSKKIKQVVLIGSALFALSVPALSQDLVVEKDGTCPPEFGKTLVESEYPYAFALLSSPPLFTGATGTSEVVLPDNVKIKYKERLSQSKSESGRTLIGIPKKGESGYYCGWTESPFLLRSGLKKMKVTEYHRIVGTDRGNQFAKQTITIKGKTKDIENPLELKALLRSNPKASSKSDIDSARRVAIYDRPVGNKKKIADVGIFSIFRVFAAYETGGEHWFFIGGDEFLKPEAISGWIPQSSMFPWESQVSLYFNENKTRTSIYANNIALVEENEKAVLGSHPGAGNLEPQESNIARFPILAHINRPYEEDDIGSRETKYQIGFFGESCDGDGQGCKSGQDALAEMSDNILKQKNFRNIDILYVLDNSRSMSPYFSAVVDGVKEANAALNLSNEETEAKVRFAAAVYGDFKAKADIPDIKNLEFEVVANFAQPGEVDHLEKLANTDDYFKDGAYKDIPEAGSAALIRSISDLNWSKNSGTKLVIWIGDHGDRQDASLTQRLDTAAKGFFDNGIKINAINVAGNYQKTINNHFIQQAKDLRMKIAELASSSDEGEGGIFDASNDDETVRLAYKEGGTATTKESVKLTKDLIVESVSNINQEALAAADILQQAFEGKLVKVKDIKRNYPNARLNEIQLALKLQGYDEAAIKRISQKKQLMTEGWVLYQEDKDNFDFWINIPGKNMRDFQSVIRTSCEAFGKGSVRDELEDAMINLAQKMSGDRVTTDDLTGMSISEIIVRYLFIPKEYFGSFLDYTPDEIIEEWKAKRAEGDHDGLKNIYEPICKSSYLIKTVIDGKRLNDERLITASDDDGYYYKSPKDNLRDFTWTWNSSSGENYYYIPSSYFPGEISRYRKIE